MSQADERQVTQLSARDQQRLLAQLNDESAEPNPALIAAAKRYKERNTGEEIDSERPRQ